MRGKIAGKRYSLITAGQHLNTVFSLFNYLMLITRLGFKQSKIAMLITQSFVVGYFCKFLGIFGTRYFFSKD